MAMCKFHESRRSIGVTIVLALAFLLLMTTDASSAQASDQDNDSRLIPRSKFDKHSDAYKFPQGATAARLVIKFNEGTKVRLRNGLFRSESGQILPPAAGVPDLDALKVDLSKIKDALAQRGLSVRRSFSFSESRLAELKARAEKRSRFQLADLSLFYYIPAERFSGTAQMEHMADLLNGLDSVEIAYVEPVAEPASVPEMTIMDANTQDYTNRQGYKFSGANGIGADYAATFAGGLGDGVNIIDVERAWNVNHEDFPPMAFTLGRNTLLADNNHGTAVVGVMAAVDNGFGITGIVPNANVGYSSYWIYTVPGAITDAAAVLGDGDIILIEVHRAGPITVTCQNNANERQCNYLPVEYWPEDYAAIRQATASGIIVVEAAGNGTVNCDHPTYQGLLSYNPHAAANSGRRIDSGAIIVGASTSTARSPKVWTNNGTRVDVHAWGENVTTLGYGYLTSGDDAPNDSYTASFGGTSSASPIVVGAAAALQGIAKTVLNRTLWPNEVRGLLRVTGTPQTDDLDRPIGPLPNLNDAIDELLSTTHLPYADFTVTCNEEAECTYTDRSYDLPSNGVLLEDSTLWGTVASWHWTFDDGTVSTDMEPTHIYTSFGDHPVTLTVTDTDGNTATVTSNTRISPTVCAETGGSLVTGFEDGLAPFTIASGTVTLDTQNARTGTSCAAISGLGCIETLVDAQNWDQMTFEIWSWYTGFTCINDLCDDLYFQFCPYVNGSCDYNRQMGYRVEPSTEGKSGYQLYTATPWDDLSADVQSVSVRICKENLVGLNNDVAYFDDVAIRGKQCSDVTCLNDGFCDGDEICVDGVCTVDVDTCLEFATTNAGHEAAGRAYHTSEADCSNCIFHICGFPNGCVTYTDYYYAVGSDEYLGDAESISNTLFSEDDGLNWSIGECPAVTICTEDSQCNDNIDCTTDSCDTATGVCNYEPVDANCSPGVCETAYCDAQIGCVFESIPICCGNSTCDTGEDSCNCAEDCGEPPATEAGLCSDDIDNDCDGKVDDDDTEDCPDDTDCLDAGRWCRTDSDCCAPYSCGGFFFRTCR